MTYGSEIKPSCLDSIKRLCKRNPELKNAIKGKMEEIAHNPYHYKPLMHGLAGERRVHIMKSFVLRFEIDEMAKTVTFIFFGHHDEAYRR